ncbi:hypothetical protein Fmac_031913 [Flemingia macrophylla]|uniref:Uncharacterized protein n=1 Tax=Flemingia macrophylla TaxID=520843 RepID=A0ABD1L3D5_9FABA
MAILVLRGIIKSIPKCVLITMPCEDISCNQHNIHYVIVHLGLKDAIYEELKAL